MAKEAIISTTPPNLIGQGFPEFSETDFNSNVWNYGYEAIVEQAIRCPHDYENSQAQITCKNCLGLGWVFVNPRSTKLLMTSLNSENKYKQWSEERLGTVSVSAMEAGRFSLMDRITIKNNTRLDNKVKYSEAKKVRTDGEDRFIFTSYPPLKIDVVYTFNGDENDLVIIPTDDYSVSDDNEYILDITYDFTQLTDWNGVVSILYEHELQYHVLDMPHDLRNSYIVNSDGRNEQITLPVNAIARRTHNILDLSNRDGSGVNNNDYIT